MGDDNRPTDLAGFWDREIAAVNAAADRRDRCLDLHGYGCDRAECGRASVRKVDVRGLVARVRANTRPYRIKVGRKNRAHWDRWRAAQGR